MKLYQKILIWLGAVLLVGAVAFIVYKQIEISNRQFAIETQMVEQKQLIDGIVRSQAQWTSKADLEKYITDNGVNLKAIKEDLDKLHAEVNAINIVVSSSNRQNGSNIPSTGPGPTNPNPVDPKNPDPYGYMKTQQNLALNEDFGALKIPLGSVGFSAWKEKPWTLDIKSRDYKVATVVGVDENKRSYFYNKFTVTVDGKEYVVPIKTAITKQEYPEAKWSFWNPRLFMGVDSGVTLSAKGELTPSLNVGVISYGKYAAQPDFSLLQVGAGYGAISQTPQLTVAPIMYNIGRHIPLMNNAYVGPTLNVGSNGDVAIMGGLRVAL